MDEYDRVPKQAEDSAMESMSSSKFGWRRRWSTPTTPDYGIHDLYTHSDMKHYLHRCEHCGYWNQMKYSDYIEGDLENSGNMRLMNKDGVDLLTRTVQDGSYQLVCQRCGKPLDRWYNGELTKPSSLAE